jgi:hypothetical protein
MSGGGYPGGLQPAHRRGAAGRSEQIVRMDDDSNSFQFWGSEQYLKGIHLTDPRGHSKQRPLFSPAQMKAFAARAKTLNRQGQGDQISVVLAPC